MIAISLDQLRENDKRPNEGYLAVTSLDQSVTVLHKTTQHITIEI